jgi:hypothetical protein
VVGGQVWWFGVLSLMSLFATVLASVLSSSTVLVPRSPPQFKLRDMKELLQYHSYHFTIAQLTIIQDSSLIAADLPPAAWSFLRSKQYARVPGVV